MTRRTEIQSGGGGGKLRDGDQMPTANGGGGGGSWRSRQTARAAPWTNRHAPLYKLTCVRGRRRRAPR